MSVVAKVLCHNVEPSGDGDAPRRVRFSAVYSDDKANENYSFSQATPFLQLEMVVSNPAAFREFEPGKQYRLTFEQVEQAGG